MSNTPAPLPRSYRPVRARGVLLQHMTRAADRRQRAEHEQYHDNCDQCCTHRMRQERGEVVVGEQHRAAEVLFERLTQDEAEEQRCWLEAVRAQDVTHPTEASR